MVDRTAVIFGEGNSPNLGDQLLALDARRFLQDLGYRAKAFSLSDYSPVGESGLASGRHVAAKLPLARAYLRNSRAGAHLRRVASRRSFGRLLEAMSGCDMVIIGGGALLSDRDLHFPEMVGSVVSAARHHGVPFAFLGVGTDGPWSDAGAQLLVPMLREALLVGVRDPESLRVVHDAGIAEAVLFGDFALGTAVVPLRVSQQPINVAYNLKHVDGRSQAAAYARSRAASINALEKGGHVVSVFTTGLQEDAAMAKRVATLYPVRVRSPRSTQSLLHLLRNSDAVVADRLHSAILALRVGTPVVLAPGATKVASFLQGLKYPYREDLATTFRDLQGDPFLRARSGMLAGRVQAAGTLRRSSGDWIG